MHRFHPLALLGSLLALSACQGVPKAPEGWVREELEVEVEVAPAVLELLGEQQSTRVEELVTDKILEMADVGLRFYPVPAHSYGDAVEHPTYLLTVDIRGLEVGFERAKGQAAEGAKAEAPANSEHAEARTDIHELSCTASATFVKRRAGGPPLFVGRADGRGEVSVRDASASLSSSRRFQLQPRSSYLPAPSFDVDELNRAVERAVEHALSKLVDPIDREFGLKGMR